MEASAIAFVQSWSEEDVYDRFGMVGPSGPHWLIASLGRREREALTSCARGRVVALLDYVRCDGAVHFGVVVDAKHRRTGVASGLVRSLIARANIPILAECRWSNAAAVALLRGCGFTRYATESGEALWRR